ncbi:hypothetical protein [Burkholderia pseudomallei]|uniref:hypothetical protein n=1 Tax=Burkholderia pseudomallei TaxID=28450 RepID=UPI001E2AAF33|nr:hypothetical protein [Burkholderia pseudomallei]
MKMPPQRRHETADAPAPPADAGVMAVSVSPRIPGGARGLAARRFCRFFRTATNVSGVFAPLRKRRIPHTVAWSARRRGMVSAAAAQPPPHREFHHPTSKQNGRFKSNKLDEEYSLCHCNC